MIWSKLAQAHFIPFSLLLCYHTEIDDRILIYVNITKSLIFTKQDCYGQENLERYVTPMVGAFVFVTNRYIW